MSTTTLTYFDFSGSRGEECRLALHVGGVSFRDERLSREQFAAKKSHFPFGAVPVLFVEGKPPLGQSNAILRLVGREHDLHPTDLWLAAQHDAILDSVEDMRHKLGPIARLKDEAEKKRQREEVATGYLPEWAAGIEKQIGAGPFVGGEHINVADLKLFVAMSPFVKGNIDHISADIFKPFTKLTRVYEAVKAHHKVVEWYAAK